MVTASLLTVSAHDIDIAGVDVDAELPVDWLDRELTDATGHAHGPGRLRARLSRSGAEVVVRGRVTASLWMPCARCLEPATADVDTELSLLLKPARPIPPPKAGASAKAEPSRPGRRDGGEGRGGRRHELPEYEFSPEEAAEDHYDGETVVLDDFVREAILLELPNFPLCSDACPGIPLPTRTARGGTATPPERDDPRLAPLRALRAKLAGPEVGETKGKPARPARPKLSTTHVAKSSKTKKKSKK